MTNSKKNIAASNRAKLLNLSRKTGHPNQLQELLVIAAQSHQKILLFLLRNSVRTVISKNNGRLFAENEALKMLLPNFLKLQMKS